MNGLKWIAVVTVVILLAAARPKRVQAVGQTVPTTADLKTYIETLNQDQLIGQVFISRAPKDPAQGRADVAKYHLGGLVLFGQDFQAGSAEQLKATIATYQKAADIPLLVATDQEGGTVSRLSDSPSYTNSTFPSPQQAYAIGGISSVLYQAKLAAQDLAYLGVNWNFAPIADVTQDQHNYIYARTFGQGYQATADYIKQVVPAIQEQHVAATLKHFPGYGAAGDTHTGFATNTLPYQTLAHKDLVPFAAGIKAGADSVMVTHILMRSIDEHYPASLSRQVIQGVLRDQLHFHGVIVTDGLDMGAISDFRVREHIQSIDVLALQAGNDALLADDYQTEIPAIKRALADKRLSEATLKAAVLHLLQLKNKLGLLDAAQVRPDRVALQTPTYAKATATLSGRVDAAVATGTKLSATVGGKLKASVALPQSGTFALKLPQTAHKQVVTLTVAGSKATATATLNAKQKPAKARAKAPARHTHRGWLWGIGGIAVVAIVVGVVGRKHPTK